MDLIVAIPPRRKQIRPVLFDHDEQVVELVSRFLRSLADSAKGYSPRTIAHYGRQLRYFCEFLTADERYRRLQVDQALATIPGGVIDLYLAQLRRSGLAHSTIRNRDVVLKVFFEWLTTDEAGRPRESSGYESGLKSPGGKRKLPRFVTKDQVVRLLCNLHNESQRCIVHFMYDTGLRVSEVPRVSKEDIELLDIWPAECAYLPLLVQGSKGRGGNNIRERYTLVSRAVYSRIRRYHSSRGYRLAKCGERKPAFLNVHGELLKSKAVQKWIADAAKRAGFPSRTVSPHRLRHGTALSILQGEAGKDYLEKLVLIQTQFGHSSVQSTEQYTHIPPSLFSSINENGQVRARFEEAQEIYDKTYLPAAKHAERRGRKRK